MSIFNWPFWHVTGIIGCTNASQNAGEFDTRSVPVVKMTKWVMLCINNRSETAIHILFVDPCFNGIRKGNVLYLWFDLLPCQFQFKFRAGLFEKKGQLWILWQRSGAAASMTLQIQFLKCFTNKKAKRSTRSRWPFVYRILPLSAIVLIQPITARVRIL